jgi:hypothetical protein
LGRLDSIAQTGLQPGGRSQYGEGYTAHSRGKVFVCEFAGLHYWMARLENVAHAESDFHGDEDSLEETLGWTPIGLRFLGGGMEDFFEDTIGSLDSGYAAGFTKHVVRPIDLEVWDGKGWVEVDSADTDATFEDDYVELDFDVLVPRKP